jgi:predicted MFS family arabinose efflux permease
MTTSPPPQSEPIDRGLWRHADFLRLWAAQAISAFGSRITRTALPVIAVTTLDESALQIAVLAAMQLVPGAILAMVAGGFVDRSRKRRILIGADLSRAVLVASLPLAWLFGALSMVHVVLVGAAVGTASALFQITDVAYLPALIGRRRLAEGNTKLETTEAIAEITGPASAGVLIAALGAPLAVVIDAASYAWSAFMLGRIRAVERVRAARAPAAAPGDDAEPVVRRMPTGEDFRVGLRVVFGHALVRPVVLTLMVWSVFGGFFMALYTLFCLRELALSKAMFGVIIAMGGVGSLCGAVLARWLARWLGVGWTMVVTSTLSLTCSLFLPLAATASSRALTIVYLMAHQLLGDGFAVAFVILAVTLRQTVLPRDMLGRANAAIHVCTSGVLPLAALLAGGLAELIGIRNAVWVGLSTGLFAPMFVWRLRHLKDMPTGDLGASDSGMVRAGDAGAGGAGDTGRVRAEPRP